MDGEMSYGEVSRYLISKVSNYLSFRPELCPEQLLNGAPIDQVAPKPQKDFLKRVLVTVEKLKLLNFRPQCRKFLEKIHALTTDAHKETSKTTTREQVAGPATTIVAPLVPATSVAAPSDAPPSDTKKPAATAKTASKDPNGKVTKSAKVVTKPKPTKKTQKAELDTELARKQYIQDYLSGKQPVNEDVELIYGAMQAHGAIFGSDADDSENI